MSIGTVAKQAVRGMQANSPVILTGLGVAGVLSTAVLTFRATWKARGVVEQFVDEEPTRKDIFKAVWPLYVPAVSVAIVTCASIIGSQSINARRQAALIGAFTLTEGAFQEYKDQVVEAIGAGKEQKVRDDIVQKQVDANPPTDGVVVVGSGNVLCLDTYTGRYFQSTMEKIRKAMNDVNEGLLSGDMYVSLNDFYGHLGLLETTVGEQVGFSDQHLVDLHFSTAMAEGGVPCLAISFRVLPRQDFGSFH